MRAWALIGRQSAKLGWLSVAETSWIKLLGSSGRNRPEPPRSADTTSGMSRPAWPPPSPAVAKGGIAIGIGRTSPLVMSILNSAWVVALAQNRTARSAAATPAVLRQALFMRGPLG